MSFLSQYENRRRNQRRQQIRWVLRSIRTVLATAILVGLAFLFDVPERLREKLGLDQPPEQVNSREIADAANPSREQAAHKPQHSAAAAQAEVKQPEPVRPAVERIALPTTRGEPHSEPPSRQPLLTAEQHQAESVKESPTIEVPLEMLKTVQREPVAESPAAEIQIKIVGLKNVQFSHRVMPEDGLVLSSQEANILFDKFPRARVNFTIVELGNRVFLQIEPQLAKEDGTPMPYNLRKINKLAKETERGAEEFAARLNALEQEQQQLQKWINSRVTKPIVQRQRARARLGELSKLIPPLKKQVPAVRAEVELVTTYQSLAEYLESAIVEYRLVRDGS